MKKEKPHIYHFRVPGRVVGRQEPQKGRHSWYTPDKTKKYYEWIRNAFQQVYPRLNDRTHRWKLRLDIYVCGKQYPDVDNVAKAYSDSLQGLIFFNDKQIWETHAVRHAVSDKRDEGVDVYAEMMEE